MMIPTLPEKKPEDKDNIPVAMGKGNMVWEDESGNDPPSFVISIDGEQKTGKTHLMMTAVNLKPRNFYGFNIRSGSPLYVIDFERAATFEKNRNFKDNKDIKIKVPVVKTSLFKGGIDYKQTYVNFLELLEQLKTKEEGILAIDGFGFIDSCTWFILVNEILGYGFNDLGKPNKEVRPHEHVWRRAQMMMILNTFRQMKIPVIITNKLKDETRQNKDKTFFENTGEKVEDIMKGAGYQYDLTIRMEKTIQGTEMVRVAKFYDSRFENVRMPVQKFTMESPSLEDIIDRLSKL